MLNALNVDVSRLITPHTSAESKPPLRHDATGTSATMRFFTAVVNKSRTRSFASSNPISFRSGHFVGDHVPDDVVVQPEISVGQVVPQPADPVPLRLWRQLRDFQRKFGGGLSDDLQVSKDRIMNQLVGAECLLIQTFGELHDLVRRLEDVEQPLPGAAQLTRHESDPVRRWAGSGASAPCQLRDRPFRRGGSPGFPRAPRIHRRSPVR